MCLGYIVAIADSSLKHCSPPESTYGQIALIVKKYLDKNPEKLHFDAHTLIEAALIGAFPCP